jgi:hypothetical protein
MVPFKYCTLTAGLLLPTAFGYEKIKYCRQSELNFIIWNRGLAFKYSRRSGIVYYYQHRYLFCTLAAYLTASWF